MVVPAESSRGFIYFRRDGINFRASVKFLENSQDDIISGKVLTVERSGPRKSSVSPEDGREGNSPGSDADDGGPPRIFRCEKCFKQYFSDYCLKRHFREKHQPLKFSCFICSRKFQRKYHLDKHVCVIDDTESE